MKRHNKQWEGNEPTEFIGAQYPITLLERVRNAIAADGTGGRTFSDLARLGLEIEVIRCERKYNNGKPFPLRKKRSIPRGGHYLNRSRGNFDKTLNENLVIAREVDRELLRRIHRREAKRAKKAKGK
jgi:hypothetical protein